MIPSVDDTSLHLFLGSAADRATERRRLAVVERAELGLPLEGSAAQRERAGVQQASMARLAAPFPRRVVERRAKHDVLDIRLAQRTREGPLPVDEEVAEENDIIRRQLAKLRQSGMHLLPGGGATASAGANANANASPGGESDNTFLTSTNISGGAPSTATPSGSKRRTGSGGKHQQQHQQHQPAALPQVYAGDVLFRPGRMVSNLDQSEFWLYARQKVTQRTLGTQVLQHPVVVGASKSDRDVESLKALILESPIAETIRKKVAALLAQSVGRTRCGILFDLLSTRNIIVSGVPHIVGQFIYEHIYDTISAEHASVAFAWVGLTDNQNLCAARDVFCQYGVLQGQHVQGTKRSFDALDNVHLFAVPPPGGVEPPLGPAVDKAGGVTRSSPLGMRPWHAAMKKRRSAAGTPSVAGTPGAAAGAASAEKRPASAMSDPIPTMMAEINALRRRGIDEGSDGDDEQQQQQQQHRIISPLPTLTHDDVLAAFDPRDLRLLPNLAGKRADNVRRFERDEIAYMDSLVRGPTVALRKMTKRYNCATPAMVKRVDYKAALAAGRAAGEEEERQNHTRMMQKMRIADRMAGTTSATAAMTPTPSSQGSRRTPSSQGSKIPWSP